jgi:hypothetical protein
MRGAGKAGGMLAALRAASLGTAARGGARRIPLERLSSGAEAWLLQCPSRRVLELSPSTDAHPTRAQH